MIIVKGKERKTMTEYKVWIHLEAIDEEKDHYQDIAEPQEAGRFDAEQAARDCVDELLIRAEDLLHVDRPIDYQALLDDIRHELEKVYRLNMNPALVLDTIDILIHEQTGLACVADKTERYDSGNDQLFAPCDFVVLTCNEHDPSSHGPIEAWAYQGPLDFGSAKPLVFGAGMTLTEALMALSAQMKDVKKQGVDRTVAPIKEGLYIGPPPEQKDLWRVVYVIDVYGADAHAAAKEAYDTMIDPDSLAPILHVLDPEGHAITFDLSQD
jgi:hypothetical protein